MIVAVVGCLHGKLDFLYKELSKWSESSGKQVDLVLCCGDFQVQITISPPFIEFER
jgi:lariat debranching enzyme